MKIILVLGLVAFSVATENLTDSNKVHQEEWELFKTQFNKVYKHQKEDVFRRNLFSEYKLNMIEHNKLFEKGHKTFTMGINKFSDLTKDEILAKISCLKPRDMKTLNYSETVTLSNRQPLPPKVDWRKRGCVTPAKDQGICGSCWAFGVIGTLETHYCKKTKVLTPLSEQNLVDCSKTNFGCNGGMLDSTYKWIMKNGGINSEESYPYESADGWERDCRYDPKSSVLKVKNYVQLPSGDEKALMEALVKVGPVTVGINAQGRIFSYKSGVYYEEDCDPFMLNHAVIVVGYGTDSISGDYWLVKNSWGESWGENGFIRMARNKNNLCGIANEGIYPIIEASTIAG